MNLSEVKNEIQSWMAKTADNFAMRDKAFEIIGVAR